MLAVLALVLLGLVLVRSGYSPSFVAGEADRDEARMYRIERLQRFEKAKSDIDRRYNELALIYAERMAPLAAFKEQPGDDRTFVEDLVRARLADAGPVENLTMTVGDPEQLAEGLRRVRVTLSYETPSDRQAALSLLTLGHPSIGTAWEAISLSADRKRRTISLDGQLAVLVIDAAE